jgi:A/G-specific adenine glycosylase
MAASARCYPRATMADGLRDAILAWYDTRGRSLPFRGTTDPYAVLVSEVMAQQTQISRVAAAWTTFMAAYPTLADLAAASPADVLRAWRGMGYNRRALNLWRAARTVVEEHAGRLPSDVAGLERLPGIGPYTARAVAAIAFGAPVGAVDTNVRRVLGRALGGAIDAFPASELQRVADAAVPADRPADWTHALMDVGATFCRTTGPLCADCPALAWCRYAAATTQATRRGRARRARTRRAGVGRPSRLPFPATSRWLRGRILDRLREAEGAGWIVIDVSIGHHDRPTIERTLKALAAEGLIELDRVSELTARLPVG